HGLSDTVILPAMGHQILKQCRASTASWYPETGHAPFLENPLRFNRELAEFARKVAYSRYGHRLPVQTARHKVRGVTSLLAQRDTDPFFQGGKYVRARRQHCRRRRLSPRRRAGLFAIIQIVHSQDA